MMSLQHVRTHLANYNLADEIIILRQSSATVAQAAQALGCQPGLIAKTLTFRDGAGAMIIVTAGDVKTDNKKFKAHFGFKAKMLSPAEVNQWTGHSIGGVCPFGLTHDLPVYLDNSLQRFDSVYPACGTSNSAIRLTIEQLERTSGYRRWIDVTKAI